jgi:aminopeptidase N
MLRDLAGNDALKQALQAWRVQPVSTQAPQQDAVRFEAVLEKTSGKDLRWFFDDWVLNDRGLPDLTIVDITPRELAPSLGKSAGWLVSVTVRNDGAAVADVPLVIRSGNFSTTQRLRIPGFGSTSTRIVVEAPPTEVLLNDGSTPEQRTATHSRAIVIHGK